MAATGPVPALLLLCLLISSTTTSSSSSSSSHTHTHSHSHSHRTTTRPSHSPPANKDVHAAIREMQAASYFTFVMLINMVHDRIPSNTAFFMPNDRCLSQVPLTELDEIIEFLARHSIPSPILFDHLAFLPTGTRIPTNRRGYMLRVANGGGENYHLNDVRLVSPNVCTTGSITCHGINGIISMRRGDGTTYSITDCGEAPPRPRLMQPTPPQQASPFAPEPAAPAPSSPGLQQGPWVERHDKDSPATT